MSEKRFGFPVNQAENKPSTPVIDDSKETDQVIEEYEPILSNEELEQIKKHRANYVSEVPEGEEMSYRDDVRYFENTDIMISPARDGGNISFKREKGPAKVIQRNDMRDWKMEFPQKIGAKIAQNENQIFSGDCMAKPFHPEIGGTVRFSEVRIFLTEKGPFVLIPIDTKDEDLEHSGCSYVGPFESVSGPGKTSAPRMVEATRKMITQSPQLKWDRDKLDIWDFLDQEGLSFEDASTFMHQYFQKDKMPPILESYPHLLQHEPLHQKVIGSSVRMPLGNWTVEFEKGKIGGSNVTRDVQGNFLISRAEKMPVFAGVDSINLEGSDFPPGHPNVMALVSYESLAAAKSGDPLKIEKLFTRCRRYRRNDQSEFGIEPVTIEMIERDYAYPPKTDKFNIHPATKRQWMNESSAGVIMKRNHPETFHVKEIDGKKTIVYEDFSPSPSLEAFISAGKERVNEIPEPLKEQYRHEVGRLFELLVEKMPGMDRIDEEIEIPIPRKNELEKKIIGQPEAFQKWALSLKPGKKLTIKPDFKYQKQLIELKRSSGLIDGKIEKEEQAFRYALYQLLSGEEIDVRILMLNGKTVNDPTLKNVLYQNIEDSEFFEAARKIEVHDQEKKVNLLDRIESLDKLAG